MRRILLAIGAVLVGVGACEAAVAQAAPPTTAPAAAGATSAAKAQPRKRLRLARAKRTVPPGVTGGTPETSARTPGGPPLGTPNGVTIPIPSLKN